MSLFNPKTITNALEVFSREPTPNELAAAARWAEMARQDFGGQNESQLEAELNTTVMQGALGYKSLGPDGPGTIRPKQPVGAGTVDLALGEFTASSASILAPLELKGPRTGLDSIMPGRAKTPVQQAWEYANDAVGARWVLVSNMRELRLYAVGHGRTDYESFDLRRIDQPGELKRLQLLLHADQLLSGATADLLARSASEDRDITNHLYDDYRRLRDDLIQFVRDQRPDIAAEQRIALVQKLLDRLIFIAFAEDSVLVPDDSIRNAVEFEDPYEPKPKWRNIVRLFEAVDKGASKLNIPPYNGGLFARDAVLDGLDLPDRLVERFLDVSKYDYRSEVSVTILGHIFEQSISDIEAMQAEARGEEPPRTGTRKRYGVVYTPDFVTRFIVERTIGAHLKDISDTLLDEHAKTVDADGNVAWKSKKSEGEYWKAYLEKLSSLRIVDPACGSGAFLIAAFDLLNAEQKKVRERLGEIEGGVLAWADPNSDVEIITRNLHGVDINAESVEITKLALWLKTAKRGRPLESLELNIRRGNSLIEDSDADTRAFVWRDAFKSIFDEGGFDIAIGNPPYVRMELLKPIKPYLEKRYEVVSDRADLYAYFFELGVRLLKPRGRLGYISSSTFFRTGSGAPLRKFLSKAADIEAVVDFGDLQLFGGVTTYPAIVVARKKEAPARPELDAQPSPPAPPLKGRGDELRFLNLKVLPADLSAAFEEHAEAMPRARLGEGSWRLESDRLDAIRAKMAAGRKTLSELYGPPLYGIKTGLNEAFVLTREKRDALVARDPSSADLLKPFLIGENLKRWHVESGDLWLIYTPKNRVDIEGYPALRDHLAQFRERLEARATKQNWWELQQAQAAYQQYYENGSLACPDLSQGPKFTHTAGPAYHANTIYTVPTQHVPLLALLNSKAAWFFLFALSNPMRGGKWRLRMQSQFLGALPCPENACAEIEARVVEISSDSTAVSYLHRSVLHRLTDIAPVDGSENFRNWPEMDFAALRTAIRKRFRGADFPVAERDEWERWYEQRRAEAAALRSRIADAEAEINERVFALYGLDADEVAAIEGALQGQY